MQLIEFYEDLFSTDVKYLAHCVSADYALGAGIAVEFNKRFDMRRKLNAVGKHVYPETILIDNVFNLVTKRMCWMKPTLKTLKVALEDMKIQAIKLDIKEIAMPKIGCGLDKLAYMDVTDLIKNVFQDTDITIRIYIK